MFVATRSADYRGGSTTTLSSAAPSPREQWFAQVNTSTDDHSSSRSDSSDTGSSPGTNDSTVGRICSSNTRGAPQSQRGIAGSGAVLGNSGCPCGYAILLLRRPANNYLSTCDGQRWIVDWNLSRRDIFLSWSYSSPSPRSTVSSLALFAELGFALDVFASGSSKICA